MVSQLAISLINMLANPSVITSIILVALGLSLSLLAGRITRAARKKSEVSSDDKLLLTIKVIGLVIMMIGLVVMMISCLL